MLRDAPGVRQSLHLTVKRTFRYIEILDTAYSAHDRYDLKNRGVGYAATHDGSAQGKAVEGQQQQGRAVRIA